MVERGAEQASIDLELLRLIAKQGRRVPYPVSIAALAMAAMSTSVVPTWVAFGWLGAVYAVLALRWWMLGRLPDLHDQPLEQRLNGHQDTYKYHQAARKIGHLARQVTKTPIAHPLAHMARAPSGNDPNAHQRNGKSNTEAGNHHGTQGVLPQM